MTLKLSKEVKMNKIILYLGILIGIIIIIATFLPWATLSFIGESTTITGLEGDGIISLVAGVLYIVMLFLANKKVLWKVLGAVLALVAAMIGLNDLIQIKRTASTTLGELNSAVQVGIGVWLVLICGILGIIVILMIKPDKLKEVPEAPKQG
jgi:hypothetical protein